MAHPRGPGVVVLASRIIAWFAMMGQFSCPLAVTAYVGHTQGWVLSRTI